MVLRHRVVTDRLLAVAFGALSAFGLAAQTCPDIGVKSVPAQFFCSQFIVCESGARLRFGSHIGGDYSGKAMCPALIVFRPGYNEPVPMKGFYVLDKQIVLERVVAYECKRDWFLFFPIGEPYCIKVSDTPAGRIEDWQSGLCKPYVPAADIDG